MQEEAEDLNNLIILDDDPYFHLEDVWKLFRYCLTRRHDFMEYVHKSKDLDIGQLPTHLLDEQDDFFECLNRAEYVGRATEWMVLRKLRKWRQYCCNINSVQMNDDTTYLQYLNEDCMYRVKLLGFKL